MTSPVFIAAWPMTVASDRCDRLGAVTMPLAPGGLVCIGAMCIGAMVTMGTVRVAMVGILAV